MLRAVLIPKSNTYPNPKGDIQELWLTEVDRAMKKNSLVAKAIGDWEIKSSQDEWPRLVPSNNKNWQGLPEMVHDYVPIGLKEKIVVCIQNHSVGGPGTYWVVDEVYVDGKNYIEEEVLSRMRSKK